MWSAIFGALTALPELLKLIESLIAWLSNQINQAKIKKAEEDLKKAAAKAEETKDTTDLDNQFDPRKKP